MPPATEQTGLDNRRRDSLLPFYTAALTSAVAIGLSSRTPALRTILLVLGTVAAAVAVWFLSRFLHSNDERERQINFRALTFSFCGTLIFSMVVGLFQSAGFHSISWLGIPILMLVLCIVPIPTLSIGYGFGGIPAPCDFGSSAFPFPPKKTSGTTEKFFCAPPEMQTLALGAVPTRFSVPQLQGQKMEKQSHVRIC
jgi:hypothetical protein